MTFWTLSTICLISSTLCDRAQAPLFAKSFWHLGSFVPLKAIETNELLTSLRKTFNIYYFLTKMGPSFSQNAGSFVFPLHCRVGAEGGWSGRAPRLCIKRPALFLHSSGTQIGESFFSLDYQPVYSPVKTAHSKKLISMLSEEHLSLKQVCNQSHSQD